VRQESSGNGVITSSGIESGVGVQDVGSLAYDDGKISMREGNIDTDANVVMKGLELAVALLSITEDELSISCISRRAPHTP
jgi:hypothetical protein